MVKTMGFLPPSGITSAHVAPWILWEIWTARNKLIFNNFAIQPLDALSRAISAAREWQNGQGEKQEHKSHPLPATVIHQNAIVLRTDAAWKESTLTAGLGWVTLSAGTTSSYGETNEHVYYPLMGDALALRRALKYCREKQVPHIHCESDSTLLINSIKHGNSIPEIYRVVADILIMASDFSSCSFAWIPRENNRNADLLTKQILVVNEALMSST